MRRLKLYSLVLLSWIRYMLLSVKMASEDFSKK